MKTKDTPTTYKADIVCPASEHSFARLVHVDLNEEETTEIREMADTLGMTFPALVRALANNNIPGQRKALGGKLRPEIDSTNDADGFVLKIPAGKFLTRLARAAEFGDQTVCSFLVEAMESFINCTEEEMLFHPKTGEGVGTHRDVSRMVRRSEECTAPTLRQQRGDDPMPPWAPNGEPPRIEVILDNVASASVRHHITEGSDHANTDSVEDLVNAAVEFFCDETDEGTTTAEFLAQAQARRLGTEAASSTAAPAADEQSLTVPEPEPGALDLTVNIPNSGWQHGGTCHVVLTAEDADYIKELAAEVGMSLEEFVTDYRTVVGDNGLCGLPNQAKHRKEALPTGPLPDLSFVTEETIRRLQRVAKFRSRDFEDVVTEEFDSTIELYEVDMLFHPTTGEAIADTTTTALEAIRRCPVLTQEQKGGAQ